MRVGFNAGLLAARPGYRRAGVNRYIERLLVELPSALAAGDELLVYAGRDAFPPDPALDRCWRPSRLATERPPVRIAWEQTALPVRARRAGLDVLHGPVNVAPLLAPCPTVVTIHDLAFLRQPDRLHPARRRYLSVATRAAVRRATRVIAVSESTKGDLVELLGTEPERVSVVPLAADAAFRPADREELLPFLDEQGLVRPFVLFVGTLEPRKNVVALLRAFAAIAPEVPHELVLVGAEGWMTDEIHATLRAIEIWDRVRLTGYADPESLPAWYAAADLFVYPSFYEGFGLPALEAMACGTPVVTSAVSALPEIVGDAGLTVDPTDVDALADAMLCALTDTALASGLRRRGLARASAFSWARTAAETVAVYREAAG